MFNIKKDFPFFKNNPNVVYLDSGSTTLKPEVVINSVRQYYQDYSVNVHSTDYNLATIVLNEFEETRDVVANFINGNKDEIIFVSSDTHGLNQIAFGLKSMINAGDEILLTYVEHGSNLLPWYRLAKQTGAHIKYIDIIDNELTVNSIKAALSSKTKIVSFANVTNVLGYINDTKSIVSAIKEYCPNIIVVVDGAQSVGHIETNVKDWDIDFLTFSAHKILGPTGVGIMWGKSKWLNQMEPIFWGSAMNKNINSNNTFIYADVPHRFEAGTPNIAGVLGLKSAVTYIQNLGIKNIAEHVKKIKQYAVEQFQKYLPNVEIYNASSESGILIFNVKDVPAQDVSINLAKKNNIFLRSGQFCAKISNEYLPQPATIRASFYLYNNFADVDKLVEALKLGSDFIDDII